MANGNIQELGIVRPLFWGAEVVEIRTDDETPWAIFRVPKAPYDRAGNVQIMDCRSETVEAVKKVLEKSKLRRKTEAFGEAARHARTVLNSGAADAVIFQRDVVGGGMNVILNPTTKQPAKALALVRTAGWYAVWPYLGRPFEQARRHGSEMVTYHLHTVVAEPNRPARVWQLHPDHPMLFEVSLEEGLVVKTFVESKSAATAEVTPPAEAPVVTERPTGPEAGAPRSDKPTTRKRVVTTERPEPAGKSDELKEAIGGPVKNGELTKLAEMKIGTAQEFLDYAKQDPSGLIEATGIAKSRLTKAVSKAKTWLKKHGG